MLRLRHTRYRQSTARARAAEALYCSRFATVDTNDCLSTLNTAVGILNRQRMKYFRLPLLALSAREKSNILPFIQLERAVTATRLCASVASEDSNARACSLLKKRDQIQMIASKAFEDEQSNTKQD